MTLENFLLWCEGRIQELDHPEPDESHFTDAATIIRRCGKHALKLGPPDAFVACQIDTEMLSSGTAKDILVEAVAEAMRKMPVNGD